MRLRVVIRGAVQGVGFRPFVFHLATTLKLHGWVKNTQDGVFIEAEGIPKTLQEFLLRLEVEKPPHAFIQSLECSYHQPLGTPDFRIVPSDSSGAKTAFVLPDIATCPQCLTEIFNPADRRYQYPFTNCTHCGPRYSIILSLPYDRQATTMRQFQMCMACQIEYDDPADRRFHAQPNACPDCGPHLEFWDQTGRTLWSHHQALLNAVERVRSGAIVAVKGLGGFHLLVDAANEAAIQRLRRGKAREEKPFALMVPSLATVKAHCAVSVLEERLLKSSECPIVLLRRLPEAATTCAIATAVAPHNPYLGVMLPYTPLHHILMRELDRPVVATSGNLSDEPICTDEKEALPRLGGIADFFLVHNRPIARHVDDSIVRIVLDRELILRRARGYAPLPLTYSSELPSVLSVGGHLKNTVAIAVKNNIFISQHIGDLETTEAYAAFENTISSLSSLYSFKPESVACDLHPDYHSTQFASRLDLPLFPVQHHHAHILACMLDNDLEPPILGVSWDGTGYGLDGTVWGGEFLWIGEDTFQRVAHFRTFPLPGGEKAIQEPRRAALGLLYQMYGDALWDKSELKLLQAFSAPELNLLRKMLSQGLNCPLTSSAGRLFDALAAIIGIKQINRFEGQAAMEVEFLAEGVKTDEVYPFTMLEQKDALIVDWAPTFKHIIAALNHSISRPRIAANFHNTLAEMIVAVAQKIGENKVALSGGCFQNRILIQRTVQRILKAGFRPFWQQRIPPNDGGIAAGQILAAARQMRQKE